jgi:hypothetical protein
MSKTKLVAVKVEVIHSVALVEASVASLASKVSMTSSDKVDNKEELEAHHLETFLTSSKSSSEDNKEAIDKEEVQEELLLEVRI